MSGPAGPPVSARPLRLGVLLLGVLAVSTASIFIRYAQAGAPSLTIAAGRLALAALLVAPLAMARHRGALARLGARQLGLALLAGAFLAAHFALWITSLEHTSVASSVVLVTTTPLWVGLLAPFVLREPLTRRLALGILLALAGGVVVGLADAGGGIAAPRGGALLGDLMALAGAWMMAGNLLVARRLRAGLGLLPYVFLAYGAAAVILLLLMAAAGQVQDVASGERDERRLHQQRGDGADDAAGRVESPFFKDKFAFIPGNEGKNGVLALEFLDVGVDDFAVFQVDRPLLAGAAREDEAARLLGIGYELDDISQVDRTKWSFCGHGFDWLKGQL